MPRPRIVLAALLVAGGARASSVSDELSMSNTQSSDTTPRTGNVSNSLNASFNLGEQWSLSAGAMLTVQGRTPSAERGQFGSSGNVVSLFSLGLDFEANDHWTFGVDFDLSPRSTQFAGTTVLLTDTSPPPPRGTGRPCTLPNPDPGCGVGDANLRSETSQLAGALNIGYDTAGESDLEWMFDAGATFTHLDTRQNVAAVRTPTGTATAQQVRDYCQSASGKCSRALQAALRGQDQPLDWERFSLSATATMWKDTDLTLTGDYYVYNQDPAQVGYFSIILPGRGTGQAGGNGVLIAPLHYRVLSEILHRFGDFSAKLWAQTGRYSPGTGQSTAGAGLRLQYKFSKAFRAWIAASGQRDVDDQGSATNAGTITVGAGYRF
jgi:hypothetical protein